ncbi:uncharacterized protein KD926_005028 [Aspergillus affinis]|uniref:uncharacterized protein n=1 Tax=Aspergillus affinis TaxID=1070780 RepID=UPI0022FF2F8A|nr:uncharacterized protein KD926_005028 [Aspergillus affinis]KAI9034914.1 hypothetical protein KD926_005028 [Aspergillus affinis]
MTADPSKRSQTVRDFPSRDVGFDAEASKPWLLIAPLRGPLGSPFDSNFLEMSTSPHSQKFPPSLSMDEGKYEQSSDNTMTHDVDPRIFDNRRRRAFRRQYVIVIICLLLAITGLLITVVNVASTANSISNVMRWESSTSFSLESSQSSSSSHHHDTSKHTYDPSSPVIEGVIKSPCGHTAAEARARGCHFDIITFCWLPDRCYDAELSESFEKLDNWKWYLDQNKTQPVPKEEALQGELDGLYVSWEYHVQHCVYMWEKMHRALLGAGKAAIDTYIGPYSHTEHCGKMLLSRGEGYAMDDINTRIRLKFPDCGIE